MGSLLKAEASWREEVVRCVCGVQHSESSSWRTANSSWFEDWRVTRDGEAPSWRVLSQSTLSRSD